MGWPRASLTPLVAVWLWVPGPAWAQCSLPDSPTSGTQCEPAQPVPPPQPEEPQTPTPAPQALTPPQTEPSTELPPAAPTAPQDETPPQPPSPPPSAPPSPEPEAAEPEATPPTNVTPWRQELRKLNIPIDFYGSFWVDTGYMKRTNARQGQYDQSVHYMQGRFVLGAGYLAELDGFYALAKLEVIGFVNEFTKSQYEAHVLDAYLRVGQRWWDFQIGRFLAWEVYHRGQGIELFTAEEAGALGAPPLYWLENTRGYRNEAGQAAVHFLPFDFLGLEVAGVYGQESNQNNLGIRPVVRFQKWGLEVMAGYEMVEQFAQTEADRVHVTTQGYAAKVQYAFPVVTAGAEFAQSLVNHVDIQGLVDSSKSLDKWSAGGFVDIDFWRNSIGLGYHHTEQGNQRGEDNRHDQAFVSYLLRLPFEGLSVKLVYGYARAHIEDVDANSHWSNEMNSFRVRVAYDLD